MLTASAKTSQLLSWAAILLILVLAFGLRYAGMNWGLPQGEHFVATYRPDEYSLFAWLKQMNPAKGDFNPHIYFNGTFLLFGLAVYYKILSWLGLVKIVALPAFYYEHVSEWAKLFWFGRLAMVVIGTLTVVCIYQAGRIAFGKKTGLIAALLYAVVPLHVVSSKHLLVEPAATLWIAMILFFCFKIIREETWKNYLWAAVLLGSACAVKITCAPLGILVLAAHFLGRVKRWDVKTISREIGSQKLWGSVGLAFVSYFVFNPYLLFNLKEARAEIQTWSGQYQNAWSYLGYGPVFSLTHLLPYGLGPLFFMTGLTSSVFACFSKRREVWLLLIGLTLHFYLNARTGTVIVKYHVFLLPFLTLMNAFFLKALISASPRWLRGLSLGFLTWMIIETLSLSLSYNNHFLKPDARDQASNWIKEHVPQGVKVAVLREPYDHSPPVLYNQYFFTGRSRYWHVEPLYKIVNLELEVSELKKQSPDYLVLSARENRLFRRHRQDYAQEDHWDKLESLLRSEGYQKVMGFENPLPKRNLIFAPDFLPDDWQQLFPEIRIYQRS